MKFPLYFHRLIFLFILQVESSQCNEQSYKTNLSHHAALLICEILSGIYNIRLFNSKYINLHYLYTKEYIQDFIQERHASTTRSTIKLSVVESGIRNWERGKAMIIQAK